MHCARAISSTVVCLALRYFSILSHKRKGSRKKIIEYEMFVLICSTTLKHFLFLDELREIWSHKYTALQVKYPLFLSGSSET